MALQLAPATWLESSTAEQCPAPQAQDDRYATPQTALLEHVLPHVPQLAASFARSLHESLHGPFVGESHWRVSVRSCVVVRPIASKKRAVTTRCVFPPGAKSIAWAW